MKKLIGFTIIECMLALTLSVILLSILIEIFLGAQKSFQTQIDLKQIQENAIFSIELIQDDLDTAGYIGCAKLTDDFPLSNSTLYILNQDNKITVSDNVLKIQHAAIAHDELIKMENNFILYSTSDNHFKKNDILLISDCKSADIFEVAQVFVIKGMQKILSKEPLAMHYEKNAEISRLEINTYNIQSTGRHKNNGEFIYALYRSDIHHHKSELVENVDKMKMDLGQNGIAFTWKFSSDHLKKIWLSYFSL